MRYVMLSLGAMPLLAGMASPWRPRPPLLPFGSRVRALREERGLTQEALAVRAGLSVSYIHRLEHSMQRPSIRTLRKLEVALGDDLLHLVGPGSGPLG